MKIRQRYRVEKAVAMPNLDMLDGFVCYLNSNDPNGKSFLALGTISEFIVDTNGDAALDKLQDFINQQEDWLFGYLSYDLKNAIENLSSKNEDGVAHKLLHFVCPAYVVLYEAGNCEIHAFAPPDENVIEALTTWANPSPYVPIRLEPKLDKATYLKSVSGLLDHIQRGDIYEINFCHEFFSRQPMPDPYAVYQMLNKHTEAPFSAYVKDGQHYCLCASPERYLKKTGTHVLSQPIKGTVRRGSTNAEDEQLIHQLGNDPKEQSENVMIVDLVRNDLSRSAVKGSVRVDELFGIYSFKSLHQMISTISCEVPAGLPFIQMVKDSYPMGSMTGAPKLRAMELSEKYESSKRGLYSGSIGYITPEGDFDFNVVIRSIQYNAEKPYISAMVGGAIIAQCEPEKEYAESLLKAEALLKALNYDG